MPLTRLYFAGRELFWEGPNLARMRLGAARVTVLNRGAEAGKQSWQATVEGCDVAPNGCWSADPQRALDRLQHAVTAEYQALGALLGRTD